MPIPPITIRSLGATPPSRPRTVPRRTIGAATAAPAFRTLPRKSRRLPRPDALWKEELFNAARVLVDICFCGVHLVLVDERSFGNTRIFSFALIGLADLELVPKPRFRIFVGNFVGNFVEFWPFRRSFRQSFRQRSGNRAFGTDSNLI